jgi:hypothetical protein
MLRRITLKLALLVGLSIMAFGAQPGVAGCSEECRAADDGWMLCVETNSYRQYCEITSRCDDCVPDTTPGACLPQCTNLCGAGSC